MSLRWQLGATALLCIAFCALPRRRLVETIADRLRSLTARSDKSALVHAPVTVASSLRRVYGLPFNSQLSVDYRPEARAGERGHDQTFDGKARAQGCAECNWR